MMIVIKTAQQNSDKRIMTIADALRERRSSPLNRPNRCIRSLNIPSDPNGSKRTKIEDRTAQAVASQKAGQS